MAIKPAEKIYEISLRVQAPNLTTVIDVLKDAAEIVSLRPIEEQAVAQPAKRTSFYAGGIRNKGVKGPDAVLNVLKDGKRHTIQAIGDAMAGVGFSPNSASPAVNVLVRDGRARKVDHATYEITDLGRSA